MSERRQRRWTWWARKGALAMAGLAALSLAATVLFAQRALNEAAHVIVRGDADMLVSAVVVDLWEAESPLTSETLASVLAKHEAQRLRYVALLDRQDRRVLVEAGSAVIGRTREIPGEAVQQGPRVRVSALIPPRADTRAATGGGSPDGPSLLKPFPRPYLVLELESPVIERLQAVFMRITAVAAVAGLVLVAFAFAWSRTMRRLSAIQQQAEGERRLVALGRASSIMAHELRNPLAALKGHAQLLVEDLAEPSRTKALRVVHGAERLERLTSVLLDFVRDGPLNLDSVTPSELVERALLTLPKERVLVDLSGAPERVHLDVERTALALRNVIRNAVQASEDAVEVRVRGQARDLVIDVRDHGPGLAPDAQEQIFDPFVTTKAQGTGLGLSIARRIAEQHDGTLTGETHPDGGAVFRLVLPLHSRFAGAT